MIGYSSIRTLNLVSSDTKISIVEFWDSRLFLSDLRWQKWHPRTISFQISQYTNHALHQIDKIFISTERGRYNSGIFAFLKKTYRLNNLQQTRVLGSVCWAVLPEVFTRRRCHLSIFPLDAVQWAGTTKALTSAGPMNIHDSVHCSLSNGAILRRGIRSCADIPV